MQENDRNEEDFRVHEPEICQGRNCFVVMQLCEEREPGSERWEPFYSTIETCNTRDEAILIALRVVHEMRMHNGGLSS